MFDLPNAKRVRREDIFSPSHSQSTPASASTGTSSPPAEAAAYQSPLQFSIPNLYKIPLSSENPSQPEAKPSESQDSGGKEDELAFEFRLFRSPAPVGKFTSQPDTHPQSKRIIIRSPTPPTQNRNGDAGGFLIPDRPRGYYFTSPSHVPIGDGTMDTNFVERKLEEYRFAAVDGTNVLLQARSRWAGCEFPWRVLYITATKRQKAMTSGSAQGVIAGGSSILTAGENATKRRPRSGKKRRIAVRKKIASKVAVKEAEREKRTRKNREKQLKRRAKVKEKRNGEGAALGKAKDGLDVGSGKSKIDHVV